MTRGQLRWAAAAAGWALVLGCAPYRMGVQSLYSCNIRTVYVPMFESDSFRRNLGERLTEAVQKEAANAVQSRRHARRRQRSDGPLAHR
jgi:hypothetical protein